MAQIFGKPEYWLKLAKRFESVLVIFGLPIGLMYKNTTNTMAPYHLRYGCVIM